MDIIEALSISTERRDDVHADGAAAAAGHGQRADLL